MVLKKIEQNGVINCVYESSNILASEYYEDQEKLTIIFKKGGKYSYNNVPKVEYLIFETAQSQGVILNTRIKQYSFINEGTIDVETYLQEIEQIKEDELTNLKLGIIERFKDVIKRYEEFKEFDESGIEVAIILFNKIKNGK